MNAGKRWLIWLIKGYTLQKSNAAIVAPLFLLELLTIAFLRSTPAFYELRYSLLVIISPNGLM
jgi:hypothetical protein